MTIIGYKGLQGLYWGYIGIMEKKMETTIWGLGVNIMGWLGALDHHPPGQLCVASATWPMFRPQERKRWT